MSEKKTIKINPSFFSLNSSNQKTEKNKKKQERRDKIQSIGQLIKPNKAKKELLKKIKEYQDKKKKEQQETKNENIVEFTETMKDSMNYLQKIIHEKKKKKELKKTQRINKSFSHEKNNENTQQPLLQDKPPIQLNLQLQDKQTIQANTHQSLSKDNQTTNVNTNIHQPLSQDKQTTHVNTNTHQPLKIKEDDYNFNITSHNIKNNNEPKYGCLKGGKKPTYREYVKTLKKSHEPLKISNFMSTSKNSVSNIERKNKLNVLIKTSDTTNHKINKSNNCIYKRYKIRKLYKTYKVGKNIHKKTVSLLLKDNKTRKKINNELDILEKTPISKIKSFLREKNLFKIGSNVPENILRQTFINSILSGDVINKNFDVLFHNYIH
jgi:hypothetical protein